ncbi:g12425 [Coccomyxa viridis]|uniref:G12425 protein n=1 Tax=Coccomyxa viridis TaxID=1274662 RepID=A0ABP1GEF3_9CHLO
MMNQANEFTSSPLARTRNAGTKRNYKCLHEGPINAEVLRDAAIEARMRRAYAALPRDPNEPPRKRGRPRKERPLGADESPPTTASDKSTNTDDNGGDDICYRDLLTKIEEPVKSHSPAQDVAVLFLAVVEQARLEKAEQARIDSENKARLQKSIMDSLKAAGRARREAAEKERAESAERARQEAAEKARLEEAEAARREAAEKARLEEAEAARREAAERARREAAVKAWLEGVEKAQRAAAQAARIALTSTRARRANTFKRAQRNNKTQKACRKGVPMQAI